MPKRLGPKHLGPKRLGAETSRDRNGLVPKRLVTDGWDGMDGWMDGWMDGRAGGRTDGQR